MALTYDDRDVDPMPGASARSTRLVAVPIGASQPTSVTVLVTGQHELLADVVIAVKDAGLDVLAAEVQAGDVPAGLPAGSIDCYVQLPPPISTIGTGPLVRARSTVAETLRARFDALARIGPMLAPDATVLLVADHETSAATGALAVLADAIEGDHHGARAFVVDPSHSPAEIAARARTESAAALPWRVYVAIEAELAHTNWRDEILGLTS